MGIFHTHVQHGFEVNRVLSIIVLLFLIFAGIFADENSPAENEQVKQRKIRNGNIITPAINNIWSPYTSKEGNASNSKVFLASEIWVSSTVSVSVYMWKKTF